jgi:hypothetical protein
MSGRPKRRNPAIDLGRSADPIATTTITRKRRRSRRRRQKGASQ